MILRTTIIKYICALTCASWLPHLITSGSELGWDLGFEFGLQVRMVMEVPAGSPLGYSINMLLGFAFCYYSITWEGYFVVVTLDLLDDFIIDTVEGYLVRL